MANALAIIRRQIAFAAANAGTPGAGRPQEQVVHNVVDH
jgi:hypothetical protein